MTRNTTGQHKALRAALNLALKVSKFKVKHPLFNLQHQRRCTQNDHVKLHQNQVYLAIFFYKYENDCQGQTLKVKC